MDTNGFYHKIKTGIQVYGTCVTVCNPQWPAMLNKAGLDFVFLDTEHIPLDRSQLAYLCHGYRALGIAPIVRIATADETLAGQAVDAGAQGVIAPYLEKEEQIDSLVYALKYRPLKGVLLEQYRMRPDTLPDSLKTYLAAYNSGNVAIANIESVPALNNLERLLAVKGLDAVFIGPHDLSVSMGLPEEYDHPDFEKAVAHIIRLCRSNGISVGIHFSLEPNRQVKWGQQGANIIMHSSDVALFSQRLASDMKHIRSMLGDTQHAGEPDSISAII